jgi:hypothetical protein
MVTTPIDPMRVPSINLSEQELDEMQELIAQGALPKDFIERHFEAVENNVFGFDHKKDRKGNPIEQGIGSPGNMTKNCVDAYKKYCNPDNPKAVEPDPKDIYDATLARLQAELKACDVRRAAAREHNRGKRRKIA